ncbi:MAG: hypothetical protein QMD96_07440 [Anaerosomatales bacterium]|nr:hypothetical protein [Anaerosomatales bacterium]
MSRRVRFIVALAAVALAVLAGATGCSCSRRVDSGSGVPSEPTPSVETTAPAGTTDTDADTSDADAAADDEPVPQDASAVIRELDAIERELDGMDLPSETDFDALEGEIR